MANKKFQSISHIINPQSPHHEIAHRRMIRGVAIVLGVIVILAIALQVTRMILNKKNAQLQEQFVSEQSQAFMRSQAWYDFQANIKPLSENDLKAANQAAQNYFKEIAVPDMSSAESQQALQAIQAEYQESFNANFESWKDNRN